MTELSAYLDVPLNSAAPAASRRVVESILRAWGYTDDSWLRTAMLVVSELVTNAVSHGGDVGALHLQTVRDQVVITAVDRSNIGPRPRQPNDQGNHRIAIVKAFSSRWGSGEYPSGKRVWVELSPHPAQGADPKGGMP